MDASIRQSIREAVGDWTAECQEAFLHMARSVADGSPVNGVDWEGFGEGPAVGDAMDAFRSAMVGHVVVVDEDRSIGSSDVEYPFSVYGEWVARAGTTPDVLADLLAAGDDADTARLFLEALGPTDAEVDVAVDQAKSEILADIASGRVPASVASFSELHDYVDANGYAGLCDDRADWSTDDLNRVQDAVHAWLEAGPVVSEVSVTVRVTVGVAEFVQGWGDVAELAASVRATLAELVGDDGGVYVPRVTAVGLV